MRASYQIGKRAFSESGRLGAPRASRTRSNFVLIPLFLVALVLPFFFYIGPTRMSPYRLILVAMFLPSFATWISGAVGKVRLVDILMLLTAAWGAIVLIGLHGIDNALQSAGIFVIETLGPYLLARSYIRDYATFRSMVNALALTIIALLPFAVVENISGSPVLIEFFGKVFPTYPIIGSELRLGLRRAQGTFEYSILFGIVCSSAFGLAYYVGEKTMRRLSRAALVALTVATSLSSGPLLSLVVQGILIAWDKATKRMAQRWIVFAALVVGLFIAIDLTSNRSPFDVFISYLTFNSDTSYMRVHIWNYGTESVMQHPILGLGQSEWEHPEWMSGSIDNFWLVAAVRYGIPGFVFIAGSFLAMCLGLGRIRNLPFEIAQCRKALIITLCGLMISMCTVHVWDAPYVLILFLLGSGMWIHDAAKDHSSYARAQHPGVQRRTRPSLSGRFSIDGLGPRSASKRLQSDLISQVTDADVNLRARAGGGHAAT
ncbi:O-antigen ligase [Rhodopseudomonas sp. B29]|uniref:O-antigen ligase family protein n=1 Tax=Rhodopseudomonas sp. B29 TaxID=95607 RepID=UPI0003470A51|nr:O-antigen ligase family protein [Rhodopseudomonas sp. B29]